MLDIPKIFTVCTFPPAYNTGRALEPFHSPSSIDPAFACQGSKGIVNLGQGFIDELKLQHGQWSYRTTYNLSFSTRKTFSGLAFGRSHIYAIVSSINVYFYNFDFSLKSVREISTFMNGITYNSTKDIIYICTDSQIHIYDSTLNNKINSIVFPFKKLKALAYYRNLYSFDNSDHVLRKHDEELNIVRTFALMDIETGHQISRVYDMDFDGYGNLWVTN